MLLLIRRIGQCWGASRAAFEVSRGVMPAGVAFLFVQKFITITPLENQSEKPWVFEGRALKVLSLKVFDFIQ
jgi:hypothetical protein